MNVLDFVSSSKEYNMDIQIGLILINMKFNVAAWVLMFAMY